MMNSLFLKRTLHTTILNSKSPQFIVGFQNGFLPRSINPLHELASSNEPALKILDDILEQLPETLSGERGSIAEIVSSHLPLIDFGELEDSEVITALFRDYCFLSSAYLLEPCHQSFLETGGKSYGLGRQVLPQNLAVPLCQLSSKIPGSFPFLEYATGYALYNWKRRNFLDPSLSLENLELIRSFTGTESEAGFILVHVEMNSHSGCLVRHLVEALEALEDDSIHHNEKFIHQLSNILALLKLINKSMDRMWSWSKPSDYLTFRTFIMGIKSQPMFPDDRGVFYEGVGRFFCLRGESGANDSIIPAMDNFLQLTRRMPTNPLTNMLKEFRSYRPLHHNQFLSWLDRESNRLSVAEVCRRSSPESARLYLQLLDQVREFRTRHWSFAREYIVKRTRHPVATGGTPILSWLPNQLTVVLEAMAQFEVPFPEDDEIRKLKQGAKQQLSNFSKLTNSK